MCVTPLPIVYYLLTNYWFDIASQVTTISSSHHHESNPILEASFQRVAVSLWHVVLLVVPRRRWFVWLNTVSHSMVANGRMLNGW
jgi:hypothetical protein